jgi:hypothetical protein
VSLRSLRLMGFRDDRPFWFMIRLCLQIIFLLPRGQSISRSRPSFSSDDDLLISTRYCRHENQFLISTSSSGAISPSLVEKGIYTHLQYECLSPQDISSGEQDMRANILAAKEHGARSFLGLWRGLLLQVYILFASISCRLLTAKLLGKADLGHRTALKRLKVRLRS